MASSVSKLDIPAKYMSNFGLNEQKGLQAILNYVLRNNLPPQTLSADGAIPVIGGTFNITKGSAAALTLAAPSASQDGLIMRIVNSTAFAHVITATNLLDDGVTGGAKDTATFGAFVGSALELMAMNSRWIVVSKNVVTIAAV